MYLKHFRLDEKPFEYLIPDPKYFYYSPQSRRIKNQCDYIVNEKNGHLFISGPIGVGKTTLLKTLTRSLVSDKNNSVNFINSPNLQTSNALMRRIAKGFDVKTHNSYDGTLRYFTEWLKETKLFPILIIDEGQNLVLDSLRTLHYLMTYVTDKLLMMIILCGQEEMVSKIDNFPSIRSRMFPASISALSRDEAGAMMQHRWSVASQEKDNKLPFTKNSIDKIWNHSKGIPRSICQTSDIALLAAFNTKTKIVDSKLIEPVIRSLVAKSNSKNE